VVTSGAEQIIRKAIDRIKYNYPQKSFMQSGVIRIAHKAEEENPTAYAFINIDAAIKIYYTPYKYNTSLPNVVLVENRIQQLKSEVVLRDSSKMIHWYQPERHDFVHNQGLFIDRTNFKKTNTVSWVKLCGRDTKYLIFSLLLK